MRGHTTIGDLCRRTVRQSTDELRDRYEKSSAHFGRRVVCGEFFKPSIKNLVGSPRQCTRYRDMLREQPTCQCQTHDSLTGATGSQTGSHGHRIARFVRNLAGVRPVFSFLCNLPLWSVAYLRSRIGCI